MACTKPCCWLTAGSARTGLQLDVCPATTCVPPLHPLLRQPSSMESAAGPDDRAGQAPATAALSAMRQRTGARQQSMPPAATSLTRSHAHLVGRTSIHPAAPRQQHHSTKQTASARRPTQRDAAIHAPPANLSTPHGQLGTYHFQVCIQQDDNICWFCPTAAAPCGATRVALTAYDTHHL